MQIKDVRPVVEEIILHLEISSGVIHIAEMDHAVWRFLRNLLQNVLRFRLAGTPIANDGDASGVTVLRKPVINEPI